MKLQKFLKEFKLNKNLFYGVTNLSNDNGYIFHKPEELLAFHCDENDSFDAYDANFVEAKFVCTKEEVENFAKANFDFDGDEKDVNVFLEKQGYLTEGPTGDLYKVNGINI
jgi:hypothetical protein